MDEILIGRLKENHLKDVIPVDKLRSVKFELLLDFLTGVTTVTVPFTWDIDYTASDHFKITMAALLEYLNLHGCKS